MLKERQRYVVRGSIRAVPRRNTIGAPPPEVGIIPGNRFILLPLKKVSALVRSHNVYPCRGGSATSIKTCIASVPPPHKAMVSNVGASTHITKTLRSPSYRRQRRRQPAIARSLLGPISEQEEGTTLIQGPGTAQPWSQAGTAHLARTRKQNLDRAETARRLNTHLYFRNAGRLQGDLRLGSASLQSDHVDVANPTAGWSHTWQRAKRTSIFSLDRPASGDLIIQKRDFTRLVSKTRFSAEPREVVGTGPLTHELGMTSGQRRGQGKKKKVRSLVLPLGRNRVSPANSEHPTDAVVSEVKRSAPEVSGRDSFGRLSGSRRERCSGDVKRDGSFGVDQTPWRFSPFVCSLANESDLPIGPLRGSLEELLLK